MNLSQSLVIGRGCVWSLMIDWLTGKQVIAALPPVAALIRLAMNDNFYRKYDGDDG